MFSKTKEPIVPTPTRQDVLAAFEALERRHAANDTVIADALAKAEAQAQRDHEALVASTAEVRNLRQARALAGDSIIRERNHVHRQLAASADPQIEAALRRLETALDEVRARPRWESLRETNVIEPPSTRPILVAVSNRRPFARLVIAAVAARRELEALKYRDVEDLPAVIAAIEASIPWFDLDQLEPDDEAA